MIYTVTCNPALDCTVRLGDLREGSINFVDGCVLSPGGKGINVSRVLAALGEETKAYAFAAGSNGKLLEEALMQADVLPYFLYLPQGQTRINVKLYGTQETQLNAPGPAVGAADFERLLADLEVLCRPKEKHILCLCGSLPPGMGTDSYARMLAAAKECARAVVDTTGEALLCSLAERPWLIKPNREELAALVGRELPALTDVIAAAEELMARGAQNVLVSLGGDGALLCTEDGRRLYQPAPDGTVIGTVGAGDSTVAGFVAGWHRHGDVAEALRLGVACGSATACCEGLADSDGVEAMLAKMPAMKEV